MNALIARHQCVSLNLNRFALSSPQVHDPPLNHIGLWVDALPEAVEWLTAQGVRFTPGGIRTGAAGYVIHYSNGVFVSHSCACRQHSQPCGSLFSYDVTFIHPKSKADAGLPYSGQGVLIELVQAPPEVIEKSK